MRKKILFYMFILLCTTTFAQPDKIPQAISYQAVARDATGKVLSGKTIGVKVEILKGATNGSLIYSETHEATSSNTGTITLLIGQGNSAGSNFADIDWGADSYFLKLSTDTEGGTNYKEVSTTQMLPVPIALYATKAGSVKNNGSNESDNYPKYIIVPRRDDDILYKVLAGKEIIVDRQNDPYFWLYFNIIYLHDTDQGITAVIEDLPESISLDTRESVTNKHSSGFYVEWDYLCNKSGTYTPKFVLKDKNNNTIKEYPFTVTVN